MRCFRCQEFFKKGEKKIILFQRAYHERCFKMEQYENWKRRGGDEKKG